MKQKPTLIQQMIARMDAISKPMIRFGKLPFIRAITSGMIATVGITMIGSLFLILYLLGSDGGLSEKALLPFLTPYASKLILVNQFSMGIMALYMAVSMGSEYAEIKSFSKTTGAVGSLFAFILLNYNRIDVNSAGVSVFPINYWGGAGVITAIVAMVISTGIIAFCYKHNLKIRLPDSVPPAIAESFSAVIPYLLIALMTWGIRTLADINLPQLVLTGLLPVLSAADNVYTYTLCYALISVFWICGLHGDSIVGSVVTPLLNTWMIENNDAVLAGVAIPHTWTPNLNRLHMWISTVWPLEVYMFASGKRLPQMKALATIGLIPALFGVVEPVIYGLPVVLNPFLALPFILTHTITGALTYLATQFGFVAKMYLNLPWATPAPILGFLGGGGSIGGLLIVFVNFGVGLLIFYPFFKAYERAEMKKESGV